MLCGHKSCVGRQLHHRARPAQALSRLQAAAAKSQPSQGKSDLTQVPGIGSRGAAKLVSQNCESVSELCRLFTNDREQFEEFLSSTGINKRWRPLIVAFVESHAAKTRSQDKITLCVEGNIGAGKTTYLDMVRNFDLHGQGTGGSELREIIEVVPEPVGEWQDVDGANLLEAFYRSPDRYAYTFQSYVFVTRLLQEGRSRGNQSKLRLLERSVFCDRMVFVKAVHEAQHLNELELKLYDSWFNPMLDLNPNLTPDGFVYLKTHPETCERRIRRRNRSEESGVQPDYLQRLSAFHDQWLHDGAHNVVDLLGRSSSQSLDNGRTLVRSDHLLDAAGGTFVEILDPTADKLRDLIIPKLPSDLEGNVVLLDSKLLGKDINKPRHSLSSLNKVPALHVNSDEDIDVTDLDQMAYRAKIMSLFRDWVLEYKSNNEAFFEEQRRSTKENSLKQELILPKEIKDRMSGSLELLPSVLKM